MSIALNNLGFAKMAPHIATLGALILFLSVGYHGLIALEGTEFMTDRLEAMNDPEEQEARVKSKMQDYALISQWHMFGTAKANNKTVIPVPIEAPETRLKLLLIGVFLDSKEGQGYAIIREQGKAQKFYRIGDDINSNTLLYAVESNRVILRRNGRHEKLSMKNQAIDLSSMTSAKTETFKSPSATNSGKGRVWNHQGGRPPRVLK